MSNVYYIDNLMWMWDEIPKGIENVTKYFISDIMPSKDNFDRIGKNIKNPVFIGPLRDITINTNDSPSNQLLINIGGASSFLLDEKIVSSFYNSIINNILTAELIDSFDKIIICGGSPVLKGISIKENDKIDIKTLSHNEYLKVLGDSSHCIMAPGLGNFIETIGQQKNIMFLPPINYSQLLQIAYYRKLKLGLVSINWNDFSFYKKIDLYMPEDDGVNRVLENVDCYLKSDNRDYINAIVKKFLKREQKDYYQMREKYIKSFDDDGAKKIVDYIISDLKIK